jgi:hypothetical protein
VGAAAINPPESTDSIEISAIAMIRNLILFTPVKAAICLPVVQAC